VRAELILALLASGCLCQTVCVTGLLWMRDGFDQLHYASAASTVGVVAIGVAVVLSGFSSVSGTIDCVVALALTFGLNPVLTSATGRAGRRMRFDTLEPTPEEFSQQP
jgi:monovalent cation/proton antiporter MnhG/PhaG subunit